MLFAGTLFGVSRGAPRDGRGGACVLCSEPDPDEVDVARRRRGESGGISSLPS